MKFYLGLHHPSDAEKIKFPVFMSVNVLANRKKPLDHDDWIMDSGGFTAISKHGKIRYDKKAIFGMYPTPQPIVRFLSGLDV